MKTFHVHMDIQSVLSMEEKQFYDNFGHAFYNETDGKTLTWNQVRQQFLTMQSQGYKKFPVGHCSNFDPEKGCQGHIRKDYGNNREEQVADQHTESIRQVLRYASETGMLEEDVRAAQEAVKYFEEIQEDVVHLKEEIEALRGQVNGDMHQGLTPMEQDMMGRVSKMAFLLRRVHQVLSKKHLWFADQMVGTKMIERCSGCGVSKEESNQDGHAVTCEISTVIADIADLLR